MARLLPSEAKEAYLNGEPSSSLVMYDPDIHQEEMMDLATGLIGAMLQLRLDSISGPEIGSKIPIVVTNVDNDIIRILIDPYIDAYGEEVECNLPRMKKARKHVELTALSYKGEGIYLNTEDLYYANPIGLAVQLQYHDKKFSTLKRELS